MLADDNALVVAGLTALLEDVDGIGIVAIAKDGREAVALCKQHQPDLAIMDVSMKELNGIDAASKILADSPATKVLLLSMCTTEDCMRRAIRTGVLGYLAKDAAPRDLKQAIEVVMRGEIYTSPQISRHVVSGFLSDRPQQRRGPLESLTPRQREVLQMIAEGKSTRNIASVLDLSIKTIETHRAMLIERLGIRDVAGLTLFAARNGLIDVDHVPVKSHSARRQVMPRQEWGLWLRTFGAFDWLARLYQSKGQSELAIIYGKHAVDALQRLKHINKAFARDTQQSFIKKNERAYALLANLLIGVGQMSEARQVMAMQKEEAYFDAPSQVSKNDLRATALAMSQGEPSWQNAVGFSDALRSNGAGENRLSSTLF